jgi:cell wall-associated NlpC family hydrolase
MFGTVRARTLALLAAFAILLGSALAAASPADAATGTSRLNVGERLVAGQGLISPSGNLQLIMQTDGNLVLYAPGGNARWNTGTDGNPGAFLQLQTDGNLVLYSAANVPLWYTMTTSGSFLNLQDDGNLVLYTAQSTAIWATGTSYAPPRLDAPASLSVGGRLQSPNGAYQLVMQGDGNLVLYGPAGWTWQSGTSGTGANQLVVQTDGNLVLYNAAMSPVWYTRTDGHGTGFLQVQDDGNLVLYTASGQWTWQTYTYPGYTPNPSTPAQQAISYATQQLGKPYVWGGIGPNGFDCSGLTMKSWAAAGITLPRVAAAQYAAVVKYPYSQAQPGDLLFWSNSSGIYHVAIYVGGGKMIEAPHSGANVRLVAVYTAGLVGYVGRPTG